MVYYGVTPYSVQPKNEPMVHSFGLMVLERREVRQGGGLGLVKHFFRQTLKFLPSRPIQIRSVRDLAQQTPPFTDHPVDIPRPQQVGDPGMLTERLLVDRGNDSLSSRPVFRRHAVFK